MYSSKVLNLIFCIVVKCKIWYPFRTNILYSNLLGYTFVKYYLKLTLVEFSIRAKFCRVIFEIWNVSNCHLVELYYYCEHCFRFLIYRFFFFFYWRAFWHNYQSLKEIEVNFKDNILMWTYIVLSPCTGETVF